MSPQEYAIVVRDLHKSFRLPHEQHTSLKNRLLHMKNGKRGYESQHVLKGVSFSIKKGEFFGIVGRNGSGKSTMLKILAGVYAPDDGEVAVDGTLTPFIELGVGFNQELTGRENVFLNGAMLGFSRRQMLEMYDEIVGFAELERFMDQKLKNYSSGMQVRLAFSIAIRARGDILLLDEVLAVGDTAFQQKCFDYFAELKKSDKTVILVTHSMAMVERFCNRALLLESGKIVGIGRSAKIAALYEDMFLEQENQKQDNEAQDADQEKSPREPAPRVKVKLNVMQGGSKVKAVKALTNFQIDMIINSVVDVEEANVGINIRDEQDRIVFSSDVLKSVRGLNLVKGKPRHIVFDIQNLYTNGKYSVDVHIVDEQGGSSKVLCRNRDVRKFTILGIVSHAHSLFHPAFKVEVS